MAIEVTEHLKEEKKQGKCRSGFVSRFLRLKGLLHEVFCDSL